LGYGIKIIFFKGGMFMEEAKILIVDDDPDIVEA